MSAKASLLVLAAGFAALWSFSGSPKPTAAEPGVTLSSGHVHDNLTVFILRGRDVLDSKHILTLQEALDRGLAVVHETSSVNMLAVENLSADHELFLQSGDIVKGGKQDRLISQDLLIQAKSGKVPCPANCCEQSRWQGRGQEAAGKFETSNDFAVGNDIKLANVSGFQGLVWDGVAKKQADLSRNVGKPVTANASPTSLQLALEDKDLRAKVAAYERDLAGLANAYPDAVGAVVAVNGQVIASDVYGSRLLFQKAWPKLLKSAAADAVAQLPKDGTAVVAMRAEAEKFLAMKETPSVTPTRISGGIGSADLSFDPVPRNLRGTGVADFVFEPVDRPSQNLVTSGNVPAGQAGAGGSSTVGFTGRSGATRSISFMSGGGANDNIQPNDEAAPARLRLGMERLNQQMEASVDPQAYSASPAVVSFESRAGSQKNALIHRGQLKK